MNTRITLNAVLVGMAMLLPASASAYKTFKCWAPKLAPAWEITPKIWDVPMNMTRLARGIDHAAKKAAYQDTFSRWNGILGAANVVNPRWVDYGSTSVGISYPLGVGESSQVTTVADCGKAGGAPGISETIYDWGDCRIVESDVRVSNRSCNTGEWVGWSDPWPGGSSGGLGRQVLYHEFGHVHGLAHQEGKFNIMRSGTQGGSIRRMLGPTDQEYFRFTPLPDDESGVRQLYSNGASVYNVANYATWDFSSKEARMVGGSVGTTHFVCPGDSIPMRGNIGNPGNQAVSGQLQFRALIFGPGYLGHVTPWVDVASPSVGGTRVFNWSIEIPADWSVPGEFTFWFQLGETPYNSEARYWDNYSLQVATIGVRSPTHSACQ